MWAHLYYPEPRGQFLPNVLDSHRLKIIGDGVMDSQVIERKEALIAHTDGFCAAHLNSEYKALCRQLIEKMARRRDVPFLRGSLEIWAAGIIHALGSMNFLFDRGTQPYVSATDIAKYFGVKPGSAAQRATMIRDTLGLDHFNHEFATSQTQTHQADLQNLMVQTISAMAPDIPPELLLAEMPNLNRRRSSHDEFIDRDHDVMMDFYDLTEQLEQRGPTLQLQKKLRALIAADADFFDPYLLLSDILEEQDKDEEANALRDEAYLRALRLVTNRKGEWPQLLEWGWLENRHIIRTFLHKALDWWQNAEHERALELFHHLLRTNPDDNAGVRHYILAIRLGLSFDDFEDKFNHGGFYTSELFDWFDQHAAQFPADFAAWRRAVDDDE